MEVDPAGVLVDRTVEEAGLRHLQELFLVEIERAGNVVSVVGPGEQLKAGDRLVFAGTSDAAVELQQIRGLIPSRDAASSLEKEFKSVAWLKQWYRTSVSLLDSGFVTAVFRTLYGAAVLAICRGGERVTGNLGQVRLQPADVLLLEARPPFIERHRQSKDFLLISELNGSARPVHEKAPLAWAILLGGAVGGIRRLVSMLICRCWARGARAVNRLLFRGRC